MGKIKRIKIYGERNTGTNYLRKLIENNLEIELIRGTAPSLIQQLQRILPGKEWLIDLYFSKTQLDNLGWKHTLVDVNGLCNIHGVGFITLTKNPYSWLLSMHNRPHHQYHKKGLDFITFLKSEWKPVKRDNSNGVYKNPILLWNEKNRAYIKLNKKYEVINLKYEDVLKDPNLLINDIKNKFNLKQKSDEFKNILESTKNDERTYYSYRDYYLNEEWKSNLTLESLEIINNDLDYNVLEYYNYQKIDYL